ncbi:hypothetical protein A9G13_02370 [Gilliamella sp. wkB178]|nr:hypothetical protein A9G13_02370 [Gilliamella apicola]
MVVPNSQIERFHSQHIGDYKVTIYAPNKPAPKDGWPIIYLLDGDSYFLTAVNIVTSQSCDRCNIQEGIIVAIDYYDQTRRGQDYLPKPDKLLLEVLPNNQVNFIENYGGADAFWHFISQELKPAMEKRFVINRHKQAIFGHSYGGLFTLYAWLTKPAIFDTYAISSPSMWFSGGFIFNPLAQYIQQNANKPLTQPVNVLLSVGGSEQSLIAAEKNLPPAKQKQLLQHRQHRKMVDYATELFSKLKHANIENLRLNYVIYPQQSHKTAAVIALQDALQSSFSINDSNQSNLN